MMKGDSVIQDAITGRSQAPVADTKEKYYYIKAKMIVSDQ